MKKIQNNKIRSFISIELSNNLKETIFKKIISLKCLNDLKNKTRIKLVEPKNYHITIAFLGNIDEQQKEKIITKLNSLKFDSNKINCKIKNLNSFPNKDLARLIYLDIESEQLEKLAKKIRNHLNELNFKLDHEFKSHITIVKFKEKIKINNLDELNDFQKDFIINSYFLMQSTLTKMGPIHEKLNKFDLC